VAALVAGRALPVRIVPVTCKDCGSTTRKTPHPGPRCATCHRAVVKGRRVVAHGRRLEQVYSITVTEYAEILAEQGMRCAICRRATGARKRLAVDHDHGCCNQPTSCGQCVRGLLCSTCNKTLGHFRDDPAAFLRGALYLLDWPSGRREPLWPHRLVRDLHERLELHARRQPPSSRSASSS
jgi:hypothetical protein